MKYDFALLELEKEIKRDQYFELPSFSQPQLVVSGYVQDSDTTEYRHWTHFQALAEIKYGAVFYDIDTKGGQSGSPAYLRYGDKVILIGIHKGYSKEDNLNFCTIITKEVTATLLEWIVEMKGSLGELELKKSSQIKSEDMIKVQQQLINIS